MVQIPCAPRAMTTLWMGNDLLDSPSGAPKRPPIIGACFLRTSMTLESRAISS